MLRELAQSIRGLLRSPAHSGIVIVTMALGIGAAATIASVVPARRAAGIDPVIALKE